MIKKGYVPYAEYQKHIRGPWQTVHKLWPHIRNYVPGWGYSKTEIDAFFEGEDGGKKQVDWARITSKPGTFPPSAHTLASHSTKAHSELSDAPADAHHPQSHTLASHSTKAHSELSDAPADAHHAQLHAASHIFEAGDELNHDDLAGFVAAEHLSLPNTMAAVLSSYLLNDLSNTAIGTPPNGSLLQYWTSDSKWHDVVDLPPATHASTHHVAGSDLVNHDSLTGFVAAEHLSLPNTIANVLSNHTKAVHDSLDIDARYIDGVEVVAVAPSNNDVLTYVLANTRWEAQTVPTGTLAGLTDTNIGAPASGDILEYSDVDSKWHNVSDLPPSAHAASHHVAGADLVNHDSLTGYVAAEHLSLPNTIANVLSNHTKAIHDGLDIDARYIDGVEVVAPTPSDTHVLMYVSANTRWENKTIGASVSLADLTDTNIGVPENADLLQYWTSDSKWHNVADIPPIDHAASHHVGGGDLVNHDSLTGFLAAEHKSLPNTIAQVLSDHTLVVHNALAIDHGSLGGRADDDHSQYYNAARHTVAIHDALNINADRLDTYHHTSFMKIAGGAFTGLVTARDHGTAATDEIVNVCYGTGNPPAANTTTIGTLFVKYTA